MPSCNRFISEIHARVLLDRSATSGVWQSAFQSLKQESGGTNHLRLSL